MLLVPRTDGEFASVGTVADVVERMRIPGGGTAVVVEGVARGVPGAAHTDAAGTLRVEVTVHEDAEPDDEQRPRARARVPRGGRGDPRPARRRRAHPGVPALDHRARRRWPTRPATRPTSACATRSACSRRSTSPSGSSVRSSCSASGSPSCRCGRKIRDDVQQGAERQQREYFLRKQMESIRKELGEDEASVADEYRAQDRGGRHAGRRARAGREGARAARADGRLLGRVVDDPDLPRLADRPCRGRSAPRSGSTRCTRARCWTPTTPASRTSRTASPSTSPCASCASSAA